MADPLRIGVIGAGRWSNRAHLPAYVRSPLSKLVAVCDVDADRAHQSAEAFNIPHVYSNFEDLLARDDIDVVDICTSADPLDPDNHERLALAAIEAGKHCLCEKPVAHDYRNTWKLHELSMTKGLKTKVGLTFRYAPAMQYMRQLIAEGFIGEPYIFNGFEQNSQFISPDEPVTKSEMIYDTGADDIHVSSVEHYGAPIIDLSLWFMDSTVRSVVGTLHNFVPYRTMMNGEKVRTNIDDGDVYIGEYENGAFCTIQSSYVTVNSYPGLEARAYGSQGALICRLGAELEGRQVLRKSTSPKADEVAYEPVAIPDRFYPPGFQEDEPWPSMFYANLVHNFMTEIVEGGDENQGNFAQSARVQEIINAVELSHRERRWVDLPLDTDFNAST